VDPEVNLVLPEQLEKQVALDHLDLLGHLDLLDQPVKWVNLVAQEELDH